MTASARMTDIERRVNIDGVPEATGPWARAVAWNGMIFISGIRGIDPDTSLPAETGSRRLELIFEQMETILEANGSDFRSVLATRAYLTDMGLRPMVNDAYEKAFGPHLPTRTILEVSGLNQNDSIEIELVAVKSTA